MENENIGEFPKWVTPHTNHIVELQGGAKITPQFPEFHVARADGKVTVLVRDANEEKLAVEDPHSPPFEVDAP
jgi:hypothetical protein